MTREEGEGVPCQPATLSRGRKRLEMEFAANLAYLPSLLANSTMPARRKGLDVSLCVTWHAGHVPFV